jgi:hypothetical protein
MKYFNLNTFFLIIDLIAIIILTKALSAPVKMNLEDFLLRWLYFIMWVYFAFTFINVLFKTFESK